VVSSSFADVVDQNTQQVESLPRRKPTGGASPSVRTLLPVWLIPNSRGTSLRTSEPWGCNSLRRHYFAQVVEQETQQAQTLSRYKDRMRVQPPPWGTILWRRGRAWSIAPALKAGVRVMRTVRPNRTVSAILLLWLELEYMCVQVAPGAPAASGGMDTRESQKLVGESPCRCNSCLADHLSWPIRIPASSLRSQRREAGAAPAWARSPPRS
jgi:hypothetical protein